MTIDDTTGFRQFAKNLEIKLNTYDIVEDGQLLFHQKAQLKGLVQAEKEFKKALIAHKWGKSVYQDFVTFICEERRNILAARPFFRERQTTFTAHIAVALKKKNDKALYQFSFNWTFIEWVLHNKNWSPNCKIRKLAREISRRRNELLEQNLPLAISQSRIFWNSVPKSHLTYMDIVQIHCQALLLSIDKFCPPNEKEMTEQEALDAYQSFRAVAIGIMRRDRVNHYCLDEDVILTTCDGKQKKIKDFVPGDSIFGVDSQGQTIKTRVVALHNNGVLEGYEATFDDGYKIVCSRDHKFLTQNGMVALKDLGSLGVFCEPSIQDKWMDETLRGPPTNQKIRNIAQQAMRGMPEISNASSKLEGSTVCSAQDRALEGSVRINIFDPGTTRDSSQNVFEMCGVNSEQPLAEVGLGTVAQGQTRRAIAANQDKKRDVLETAREESRKGEERLSSEIRWPAYLATGKSTESLGQSGKSAEFQEKFQNGRMVSCVRNSDMAHYSNSVWGEAETSRFCKSQSQNLGRNRRTFPFYRFQAEEVQEGDTCNCSIQRRNAQSRSCQKGGCNSDSYGYELLSREGKEIKISLADLAYSHAPLTNSGNLVVRRVVQIRSVGQKQMYDLEVDHPKHNFLLPNGIVTSNSETSIHFYPDDRAILYRANKHMRTHGNAEGIDWERLAQTINVDFGTKKTNPQQLIGLVSASSTVSADFVVDPEGESILDAAVSSEYPEETIESNNSKRVMHEAISKLTLRERKILIMKGISNV